jgi:hypothetical protein
VNPEVQAIIGVVTAIATCLAAIFAAISAWTSKKTSEAAQASVDEARETRKAQLLPRLTLEKTFLDLVFFWPHPDTLNGEAVFLARRHWKDKDPAPPSFILKNFGESPALDVTLEFTLTDNAGDFIIPEYAKKAGLCLEHFPPSKLGEPGLPALTYMRPDGFGSGLPLYSKETIDLPSCSPSQERSIELPQSLCNRLFLRGLQFGSSRLPDEDYRDIVLTVLITCYTVAGEPYTTTFQWKVSPFSHGETSPIKVYGHCNELPINPKPNRPRVAV